MKKHGKKFTAARAQVAVDRTYAIEEAMPLMQKVKFAKFDATVEESLRLGRAPARDGQEQARARHRRRREAEGSDRRRRRRGRRRRDGREDPGRLHGLR